MQTAGALYFPMKGEKVAGAEKIMAGMQHQE
jgi:hypothetical protein